MPTIGVDYKPLDPLGLYKDQTGLGSVAAAAPVDRTGNPVDTKRPKIENPDGSFSTEETITIEADGKWVNIPTIVAGQRVGEDQAIELFKSGKNPPVGAFPTLPEAETAARGRSEDIGNIRGGGGDPQAKGLARLAPREEAPKPGGKPGTLRFVNPGQDKIDPTFRTILEATSSRFGMPLTVTSGYRSPQHPVERRKKAPGEHARGTASDISLAGMNEAQRAELVRDLRARGVKRFGLYSNTPNMLHVDLKDQTGGGDAWFMYDRTAKKLNRAPAWFRSLAGDGEKPGTAKAAAAVTIDEGFAVKDPMGLYSDPGANPFKPQPKPEPEPVAAEVPAPAPVPEPIAEAGGDDRYKTIDAESYEQWKADWEARNRSSGVGGDVTRMLTAGNAQLGLAVREAVGMIPGVGPTIVRGLDSVDEWLTGKDPATRMQEAALKADSSVTEAQAAADPKEWVIEETQPDGTIKFLPGPAMTDPRSYLRGVVGSAPSTIATMGPAGLLARGAYASALARGASQTTAAATAARTAMIAGGMTEGVLGGAEASLSVRERIAALPREVLEQSEAIRTLREGGMSLEDAVATVADDAATQSFIIGGVATAAFGGSGDRVLASILAEGVGGGLAKRILSGAARGAVAEGVFEELPQSAAQQAAGNYGVQQVDPSQRLGEGVANAAVGGLAAGGIMGGGMGAAGGAAAGQPVPPSAPAPAPAVPPKAPTGPLSRALGHGETIAQRAIATVPDPAAPLAAPAAVPPPAAAAPPEGRPAVGATVRVDAEGIEPFMATVDQYADGEVLVFDRSSGEIYQVPLDSISQIAEAPKASPDAGKPAQPVLPKTVTKGMRANLADLGWSKEQIAEMSPIVADTILRENRHPDTAPIDPNDTAIEPVAPAAAERTVEPPSAKELIPVAKHPRGAPAPGASVFVEGPDGRFAARVERYEGEGANREAVVVDEAGTPMQVPLDALRVSKLTEKEAAAQDLVREPPVDRAEAVAGVKNGRKIGKHTVSFPDDLSARLYDLGRERRTSVKLAGASSLDRDAVMPAAQRKLADELGVTPEGLGQIADDYRFRVERAAGNARSDLPTTMMPVNPKMLKRFRADREQPSADTATTNPVEKTNVPDSAAVDAAGVEAATSPQNDLPEPTDGQKEAGNYKLGHVRLGGLDLSIENPAGSTRSGTSQSGKAWSVEMKSHYGYIKRTEGKDGDHVDVFVKPGTDALDDAAPVFVVDQRDPSRGRFDEHKVLLGFESKEKAETAYRENYTKGWTGLGAITETTLGEFKAWLDGADTTKPFADAGKKVETTAVARKPERRKARKAEPAEPAAPDRNNQGPHYASGFRAAEEGKPRALPRYFTDPKNKNAKDYLRGWDDGNRAPPAGVTGSVTPAWGANNTLVTADRAAEVRKRLREKLRGQISAGIDPEILALGAELAAFHVEAGARRFRDFAKAVAADMATTTEALRPFLRAWYNAARDLMEDSGVSIDGMDDADTVRAELQRLKAGTDEAPELDQGRPAALEGQPSGEVREPAGGRNARRDASRRSEPDLFGSEPARGQRNEPGRGLGDGADAVSVSAGRGVERAAAAEPAARDDAGPASRSTPVADASQSIVVPAQERPDGYTITAEDALGEGGAKTKFRQNVAAIDILRTLETEARPATRSEQSALAKWVGWGGLRTAFYREDGSVAKGWESEAARLKELLTPEEYRAAEASSRNAHYTSPEVVGAIWSIAKRLGFRGGLMLEPSVGAGNFIGLMPADLRKGSGITGVELDRITGGVAKNLYPQANIQAPLGYQDLTVPDGYFDIAIGNPPFGSERLYDAERRELNKFSIHNYFFAKSIDALRPGGVLAMVVTNYFLDAGDAKARAYIAARADLVAAIRLPNNAFLKNAGTEITTDIIVLQKRAEGTPASDVSWVDVTTWRDAEGREVPINRWLKRRPEMMLGKFGAYGTMYRGDEAALVAREDDDLPALLEKAIATLPENIMPAPRELAPVQEEVPASVETALVGSAFLDDKGALWVRKGDVVGRPQAERLEVSSEKGTDRVAGLVRIRDAFTRLRRAQISDGASDADLSALRTELNTLYDAFVKANGPINGDANKRLFRDDPSWPQVAALETDFDKGVSAAMAKKTGEKARAPSAKKAAIFRERTQRPYAAPTSARSAKDALAQVLNEYGRVDLGAMSRLYGKTADAIVAELGNLLYRTPDGSYETADAYLTGNVRHKLAAAEKAAEADPSFRRNVAALRDVIPADIEPVDIDVKAGAPWIPANHVADFVAHIAERAGAKAFYSRANARWAIDSVRPEPAAQAKWGTERASLETNLSAALNGQNVTIYDKVDDKAVVNQAATEAANEKVQRIKDEWARWIWTDDNRRDALGRLYNDTFNTDVERIYDGSHLSMPGKVSDDVISFRPHQKNFVWRALQSSTVLADHVVGAGKTFAAIAAVMEKRRIGQWRKPLLVVPNHLVGQWAADFVRLYPGARILAATKKDFEAESRKKFFVRMATGDWDAIIVSHSSFGRIGVDPEFEAKFIRSQMDDLEVSMKELREATGEKSRNVGQLQKWRTTMEEKLKRLLDSGAKDQGLTFNEIGIDGIVVDEAHEFKNLGFATSMTRVAGLGNPQGSQKAADLYIKTRVVMEKTGGKNVMFLTGTPISNTMAEMFTVQRYLDEEALRAMGIAHFDAWARVFGEVVNDWELSPSGQYKLNSRFARFVNMPELMQRYRGFADVITNDDIRGQLAAIGKTLPIPRVKGGKPQNIVVERSPDQAVFIGVPVTTPEGEEVYPAGSLVYRAENLPKKAEKGADNMLKVMSDARKAALDMRLIDSAYPDFRGSKVHEAADRMKAAYDRWAEARGAQLVFIDLSTPKSAKSKEVERIRALMAKAEAGDDSAQEALDAMSPDDFMALDGSFSVYDDLRKKLIDRGIPAEEIAFIHDANTDAQKEELFGKVRSGRVRFLFGSTAKMGAGTNVQNRLVALHHLDAPWRPSDLEQREGRIIRQGNELYAADPDGFEVEINRYATKNTLDARMWQTIEAKAKFIAQVRKGTSKDRVIEDIAGEAANAAEMKAAASGNPLILEEMDLRQKIKRLENLAREHDREQHTIAYRVREFTRDVDRLEADLPKMEADAGAAREARTVDGATIEGSAHEKPKEIGAAIIAAARKMEAAGATDREIGAYGSFKLHLSRIDKNAFVLTIEGARDHEFSLQDIEEADAVGTAQRLRNTVAKLMDEPDAARERIATMKRQIPALDAQRGEFSRVDELDALRRRHGELLDQLKPKKKPAAAATQDPEAQASIDGDWPELGGNDISAMSDEDRTEVERIIREVSGLSEVAFRKRIELPRGAEGWGSTTPTTASGVYSPAADAIAIALTASDPSRVAYHEAFHRLQNLFLTDDEKTILRAEVGRLRRMVAASPGRARQAARMSQREIEAEAFAIYASEQSAIRPHKALRAAWDRMTAALRRILNYLAGRGFRTSEDIFTAARAGKIAGGTLQSVESAAFKSWFGRSKVVDAAGKPMVVYHGTDARFSVFDRTSDIGFHFGTADTARVRLEQIGALDSGRLMPVYLKAENPLRVDDLHLWEPAEVLLELSRRGIITKAERLAAAGDIIDQSWAKEKLAAKGYDSIVYRNYFEGDGSDSYIVFDSAQVKSATANAGTYDPGNPDIHYSIAPETEAGGRVASTIADLMKKPTDWTPAALAAVPLNYFSELKRPGMTAIDTYLRLKRQMDTYRGKKHAAMDEISQDWRKYARLGWGPAGKAGRARAAHLADLMHESTLAGIDPSSTAEEMQNMPGYDMLRARYLEMPESGRHLYRKVRDAYTAQAAELDAILLDNIRKAQAIAQDKAEEQHRREVDRINRSRMSPRDKEMALADADKAFAAVRTRSAWSMKARLTRMRTMFEASRVQGPYFPLARFGRYTVTVRDIDGAVLSFSKRETVADRDRLAAQMKRDYPSMTVDVGVMDQNASARDAMDPRLVAEIETILGGAGLDPKTLTMTLDQVWQRYLETLPDLSTRKRFIHRKGTAGFDADALRAFASHMFHAAHQMGRLKYGIELNEMVNRAGDQARQSDDPTRGVTLVNELRLRNEWVMNPKGGKFAQSVTSAMFVWYLGATPAAAVVNLTQTALVGIPVLGSRLGGLTRAAAALAKASADTVAGYGSITRANLPADEKRAVEAFYDSGLIDRTQSHDLAGVGETGVEYSPVRARVMAAISWMFHRAEVANREITALAAYRMARAQGQSEAQAIDTAHDLTWKTHFDYANSSRARILQTDTMKVLATFQNYQLNMWYRIFRDAHQSLKGESWQVRKEARHQFAGLIGMITLMGGIQGVFGYSVLVALAGLFLDDDEDPRKFNEEMAASVRETFGPRLGGMILRGVPGELTGIDLTSRIGMPDLFIRPPDSHAEGRDWYRDMLVALMGVSGQTVLNVGDGLSLISDGSVARGAEVIAPKALKDLMQAYRYANEGILSRKGDPVIERDNVQAWDIIAEAMGFTSAHVAERYETNRTLKNAEQRVLDERRELINRFALAEMADDAEGRAKAVTAIKAFNAKPYGKPVPIKADTLRRSLKTRATNSRKRVDGVLIQNERLGHYLRELAVAE